MEVSGKLTKIIEILGIFIFVETVLIGSKDIFINILILLTIIVGFSLCTLYSIRRVDGVNYFFESVLKNIFLTAFFSTLLLTILLLKNIVPDSLNSIYILLGSLMVAVVGIYLNRKLDVEKENKKIKRINSVINSTISSNKSLAEDYLLILSRAKAYTELRPLKKSFWDILISNITEVDLDPNLVDSLLSIKELSFEINDLIKERENYLLQFEFSGIDGENISLNLFNESICKKSRNLIEKSEIHIKKYGK